MERFHGFFMEPSKPIKNFSFLSVTMCFIIEKKEKAHLSTDSNSILTQLIKPAHHESDFL